ncbi:MAG: hypothetical protein R8K20_02885 [Gallionellaceae bacterium]
MSNTQKDEESPASDNKRVAGAKVSAGGTPTKKELLLMKLKGVLHFTMLGFAPVVAVLGMVLAVFAFMGNQSTQKLLGKHGATIKNLTASLSESKLELKKFKMSTTVASREMSLLKEKLMKQDEQLALIIQNVTPLQVKMKISPTLTTQLLPAVSGVVSADTVKSNETPVTVKHAPQAKHKPNVKHKPKIQHVPQKAHRKTHSVKDQIIHSSQSPSKSSQSSKSRKQLSPEVQAMKEAIEQFNKQ